MIIDYYLSSKIGECYTVFDKYREMGVIELTC